MSSILHDGLAAEVYCGLFLGEEGSHEPEEECDIGIYPLQIHFTRSFSRLGRQGIVVICYQNIYISYIQQMQVSNDKQSRTISKVVYVRDDQPLPWLTPHEKK